TSAISVSSSVFKQPTRHDSSPPGVSLALGRRLHFPFPHVSEGAERRKALRNRCTSAEVPRALRSARTPPGAPHVASLELGTVLPGEDWGDKPPHVPDSFRRPRSIATSSH